MFAEVSDLGRAVGYYIGGIVILAAGAGVIAGIVLSFGIPALWHFAAGHISIH